MLWLTTYTVHIVVSYDPNYEHAIYLPTLHRRAEQFRIIITISIIIIIAKVYRYKSPEDYVHDEIHTDIRTQKLP